jgi:hypothetical protein
MIYYKAIDRGDFEAPPKGRVALSSIKPEYPNFVGLEAFVLTRPYLDVRGTVQ